MCNLPGGNVIKCCRPLFLCGVYSSAQVKRGSTPQPTSNPPFQAPHRLSCQSAIAAQPSVASYAGPARPYSKVVVGSSPDSEHVSHPRRCQLLSIKSMPVNWDTVMEEVYRSRFTTPPMFAWEGLSFEQGAELGQSTPCSLTPGAQRQRTRWSSQVRSACRCVAPDCTLSISRSRSLLWVGWVSRAPCSSCPAHFECLSTGWTYNRSDALPRHNCRSGGSPYSSRTVGSTQQLSIDDHG